MRTPCFLDFNYSRFFRFIQICYIQILKQNECNTNYEYAMMFPNGNELSDIFYIIHILASSLLHYLMVTGGIYITNLDGFFDNYSLNNISDSNILFILKTNIYKYYYPLIIRLSLFFIQNNFGG